VDRGAGESGRHRGPPQQEGGAAMSDALAFVLALLGIGVVELAIFAFGIWLARRMGINL
jgi:hypothetical protein